jgi:hypothetical protein
MRVISAAAGFGFREVTDGETAVSKITLSMLEFPVTKLQGESNDHFLVRVELGAENIVGSYIRGEHDACKLLPNGSPFNRVFEQAGVVYGPRLEPGSEATKEAAKKRKNDARAGPTGKRAMVSSQEENSCSESICGAKGQGRCFVKNCFCAHETAPKDCVPVKDTVQKTAMAHIAPKAGTFRISSGTKRLASAGTSHMPAR